jgi:hypothetical protein
VLQCLTSRKKEASFLVDVVCVIRCLEEASFGDTVRRKETVLKGFPSIEADTACNERQSCTRKKISIIVVEVGYEVFIFVACLFDILHVFVNVCKNGFGLWWVFNAL